ncbi:unnamed protein product [Danaus chrysippus]|uniref:(African queen) hypothetical protein n=1 Tax=Danaus chrysippus TaxID=151541 RepID=A0A8J2QFU4_9NEOP|nr:unnamed protein product [Danaus chrysippus]
MNQKTSSNPTTVSNIDDKPVLHNDLLMESTRSETELPATAEMEIILNEIKQREIQTMADHLPSFSNLIKNAVTEITFSTMPIVSESNVSPNLISFDDIGKNRFSSTLDGTQVHNSKLRNIFRRSIKEDTSTLANDVENFLQNKLKKVYKQIKNKFSKDLRNDMNKKTSTVKKQLDKKFSKKINMTQHTKNPKFNNSFATKSKIVKMHNNSTRSEVRKSRKTLLDQRNHQIESIDSTPHTIPSIGDDVSMLAVLENIIEKSQHDNEVILNTLSYGTEKHKQEKSKRDSPRGTLKRDIHQELNNKEDGLYTEYAHWESNKNNTRKLSEISKNDKRNNEISTEDTSYQGLSNKISYNDYVNGYKYYLNFQRDNDDQKYSSQIRYQAHKHHNVDDIGKFILDKIPHLPATRMRRYLVDYETMEDQDVSTKSEESWFKKHFFMFIDSNPPKKFHTSQIVPLKPSEVHNMRYDNAVLSTKQTFEKNESSLPIQQRKSKFVKRFDYNCLKVNKKKTNDIAIEQIGTTTESLFHSREMNTISYAFSTAMTKNNIQNEVDEMALRLSKFSKNKEIQKTTGVGKELEKKKESFNYDDFQMPEKNSFTPTPIDFTAYEYDNSSYYQENKNYGKNKQYKLEPIPDDLITLAYDESITDLQENKNFVKKKNKYERTLKDLITFVYEKSDNNEVNNFGIKKKKVRTTFKDQATFEYDEGFNNLEKEKPSDQQPYTFRPTSDLSMSAYDKNFTTLEKNKNIVRHFNDNKDVNIKRPVTKVNTPPKQYYSTPIPMKNADFNKFLKNLDIDVESVTAPLSDPLPERIDAWDLFEQNVTGLINKQQKILKNYERFKSKDKNKKILDRPLVYGHIYPNSEKMNINNSKVKSSPPPLKSQKQLGEDKKSNKNSQKRLDRTKNEKNIMNDERLFKLKKTSMVFATSESLDLFQLNDPKKQPINSNKIGNFDVTLNNCRKSILGMHNSLLMKNLDDPNNLQLVTMKSKTSNKNDSNSRDMNNYRDRLPFTHMPAKNITTKAENNQLYKFINQKKKLSQTIPRRVQISGHSYKYDIIYQTPMNYWMQDLDAFLINVKEENYTPLEPLSTNYTLTPTGKVLKSNLSTATKKFKKYFYFALKEPKNMDDVVYFEPLLRRQINRKKEEKPTCKNKIQKRGIQSKNTFTAKGVAALEVVVDLVKSTETLNSKELRNASPDMEENKNVPYILTASKTDNHATNSIQVHIALPNNLNDRKRSLEPIKVRKVFSAVMSTPVDLEYQIRTFEDDNVTKMSQDVISPGLYLLVENTNITSPNLNFALKPIRNIGISNLLSFENNTCKNYIKTLSNGNVSKATINPDIITTVYSQLVKLDENIPVANETKSKRYIKDIDYNKIKRGISWDKMKRYFDHERVCNCRCKINTTMCKPCAASDAVISELTFEFDNLVNYVTDHCTEIQTFFWMNPTGGRKLKDSVHRLDTTLNNYYKRLHDKCRDANGHREYHSLAADMDPNSVNVVLLCSAGFYLVVGQKICAVCPPNTFSLEGENVCRNCPQGSSSEPGSRSCRLSLHSRKYRCPWKYECGAAVCMLSCVIACCYTVLRLLRQPVSAKEIKTNRKTRQDSQETRFELWKEKNTLPPLPPIDFEL